MGKFSFESMDVSAGNNGAIAAFGELLWEFTSERGEEERQIDKEFEGVLEELEGSFDPTQRALFGRYQHQMEEELHVAEQRRFVCGFKTAMRLVIEGLDKEGYHAE